MLSGSESESFSEETLKIAWYVAYTKHQHEKAANLFLEKKGFETLLPIYRTPHQWKDRKKVISLPLFPCYLFIRTELSRKLEILQTPGIFWLVENCGRACEVPPSEMEFIQRVAQNSTAVLPHPFLKRGDRVRIHSGPFAGLEGLLVRMSNQYRVVLSVQLLQKSVAVEVDLSVVEALDTFRRDVTVPPARQQCRA